MDPADEEAREIYARYGLAMYFAQVVEHAIVNLMVALRLPERGRLTVADIDELMNQAFGMTFGRLLGELRRQTDSADHVQEQLDQARETRNWLAHRYFRERAAQFMSPVGRVSMLSELDRAAELFRRVDSTLGEVMREVRAANGFHEEDIREEYERLVQEAESWRPEGA